MKPTVLLIAAIPVAIAACTQPAPQNRGADLYAAHCISCHGKSAQGDGPLAARYGMRPANLTLLSQNNGGVFPSEGVMAQINGYPGRHDFGGMPEFEHVLSGTTVRYQTASGEVIETQQALIDIATYLETLQQ